MNDPIEEAEIQNPELIMEKENELLQEIARLEAEAKAKKEAAEKAIRVAMNALDEVQKSHEELLAESGKNLKSVAGTIDEIALVIAVAEKETQLPKASSFEVLEGEGREGTADAIEDKDIEEEMGDSKEEEAVNTSSDEEVAEEEDIPRIISPPTIVRETEIPLVADISSEPNLSDESLDTILAKIEECSATISDPLASHEDQMAAAKLVGKYAKAASTFQNAM